MGHIIILASLLFIFTGCKGQNKTQDQNLVNTQVVQMAQQIKIDQLISSLEKLKDGKTEYDFIGITSNGTDCIYFVKNGDKFNIEFEGMGEDQLPYFDLLEKFALSKNIKTSKSTYNNTPNYKSDKPAPVLILHTDSDLNTIAEIAKNIQETVFGNNSETVYDIVP